MNWYNLCKKYKILDWIDDNIVWYIYDKPKNLFKTIRYWFYCNWNKEHWRLVKSTFVSYPWDSYFMYHTLECYIDQQLRWFNKHKLVENVDEEIVRPLRWAKHCVHVLNNDTDLYEYDIFEDSNRKYKYLGPYLNYKTLDRYLKIDNLFKSHEDMEYIRNFYIKHPDEYYMLKCKYMLYRILWQYSGRWWD